MSKRSVKVNTFFPKRIFAPDIWGANTEAEAIEEYDEYKIISKFAAKTIPSSNSTFTRGQKYASNEQNEFGYVGNFSDEFPNGFTTNTSAQASTIFPIANPDSYTQVTPHSDQGDNLNNPINPNENVIAYKNNFDAQQADKQVIQYEKTELENEALLRSQQMQEPVVYQEPVYQAAPIEQHAISYHEPVAQHDPVVIEPTIYIEPVVNNEQIQAPTTYQEPDTTTEPVIYQEPAQSPEIYHEPAQASTTHEEVIAYHEPAQASTTHEEAIAYHEPIHTPTTHEEAIAYHEPIHTPTTHEEAIAYHEPIHTPTTHEEAIAYHETTQVQKVESTPQPMSEYERLVAHGSQSAPQKTNEENTDFNYFSLSGKEEVDPQNNSLQFENSEFVTKQIENIHTSELEESKSIHELLMVYKKKIFIGVAAVIFVMCLAILYIAFTSGGDTPNVKAPADLNSGTDGEKPVVIVPSQNGGEQQSGYDANGNPIGS